MSNYYTALRSFCETERQAEILEACIKAGSNVRAAKALGVARQTVDRAIKRIRRNAARQGYSPEHDMTKPVPDGFHIKGISSLYDEDGNLRAQWVKSDADAEDRRAAMRLYVEELTAEIKPRKKLKAPKIAKSDLMVGYPIGDHHFGMYATVGEAGGDYNLDLAKSVLSEAIDYLVASSPPAETALLANLGDFTHTDNRTNMTPKGGHILDVAARYNEICRAAAFALAYAVERILEKHKRVKIINCPGNHDQDTAGWLSLFMQAWFKNEPRVEVETSARDWLFHQFGKNMICLTHGHKSKLEAIPGIMATLEPEMWGDTLYRVAWTGHVHHAQKLALKENHGAEAESFGILGPADRYAANLGYRSQQEMHSITFKKSGGVLCRSTYNAVLK